MSLQGPRCLDGERSPSPTIAQARQVPKIMDAHAELTLALAFDLLSKN